MLKFMYDNGNGESPTRLSCKLSDVPISKLSDDDTFIKANTKIQRIVEGKSFKDVLANEKVKDIMYATYDKNDNLLYPHIINPEKGNKQMVMTIKNTKDLISPSERKRISTFVDMVKENSEFREALTRDLDNRNWLVSDTINMDRV